MNEISNTPEESDGANWRQFEAADGRFVIYEVGTLGGWIACDGKTPNRR